MRQSHQKGRPLSLASKFVLKTELSIELLPASHQLLLNDRSKSILVGSYRYFSFLVCFQRSMYMNFDASEIGRLFLPHIWKSQGYYQGQLLTHQFSKGEDQNKRKMILKRHLFLLSLLCPRQQHKIRVKMYSKSVLGWSPFWPDFQNRFPTTRRPLPVLVGGSGWRVYNQMNTVHQNQRLSGLRVNWTRQKAVRLGMHGN